MAHDVFISHSSKDKPIADAVCANLEGAGVRCWIAPRDISPGEDWPAAIATAISQSRVMVLVFSANANSSEQISRELSMAADYKLVIIPFKIEDVKPEPGKQYFLSRTHWLDAINPPTQAQIDQLLERVNSLVPGEGILPTVAAPVQMATPAGGRQTPPTIWPVRAPGKRPAWMAGIALLLLGLMGWMVFTVVKHSLPLPAASEPTSTSTEMPTAASVNMPPKSATEAQTAPAAPNTILLADDFSDPASGWSVLTDEISQRTYQDGEYVMRIGADLSTSGPSDFSDRVILSDDSVCHIGWSLSSGQQFDGVAIDVDVRYLGGPGYSAYGIVFDYRDAYHYKYFLVSPYGGWALSHRVPDGTYDLVGWTQTAAIKPEDVNHLRVELRDKVYFYMNGELLYKSFVTRQPGDIGFWMDNCNPGIFEAAFDNLVVTQLP